MHPVPRINYHESSRKSVAEFGRDAVLQAQDPDVSCNQAARRAGNASKRLVSREM